MASFKYDSKITLEIEGHRYIIDGINKNVIEAVKQITQDSMQIAMKLQQEEKDSDSLQQQIDEMNRICWSFLVSILGNSEAEKLMAGRVKDILYLNDLCQYILQEITNAKTARIHRLMGRS